MEKDLNPEEKLLRLIRNKNKDSAGQAVSPEKPQPVSKAAGDKPALFSLKQYLRKILSIKRLKIILSSLVVVALLYAVWEILFLKESKTAQPKSVQNVEIKPEAQSKPLLEPVPFEYYANKINKRDIFKPAFEQGQPSTGGVTKSTLSELAANLRLAGIIVDKQPQAIIEDTKQKKTYFLSKGDFIGEIKVEDILESKVILSYGEEKIELIP